MTKEQEEIWNEIRSEDCADCLYEEECIEEYFEAIIIEKKGEHDNGRSLQSSWN